MEEKTLEVSVAKFMELCRTDARMDALISYIESEEVAQYDYVNVKKQRQRQMETAMRAQREKVQLLQHGGADSQEVMLMKAKYQGGSTVYIGNEV